MSRSFPIYPSSNVTTMVVFFPPFFPRCKPLDNQVSWTGHLEIYETRLTFQLWGVVLAVLQTKTVDFKVLQSGVHLETPAQIQHIVKAKSTMKLSFTGIFTSIVALLTSVHSQQLESLSVIVHVNSIYGNCHQSLSGMTCANNFPATNASSVLGDISIFPNLGGSSNLPDSDCVDCVIITNPESNKSITVLFINNSPFPGPIIISKQWGFWLAIIIISCSLQFSNMAHLNMLIYRIVDSPLSPLRWVNTVAPQGQAYFLVAKLQWKMIWVTRMGSQNLYSLTVTGHGPSIKYLNFEGDW